MKPNQMLLLGAPFLLSFLQTALVAAQQNNTFDWGSLQGSGNVTWVSCYGANLQCARFNVPLNYSDPTTGTGTIAMIQIPSTFSHGSPEYKGPLFVNPGGPGGSGVDLILGDATLIPQILGSNFDVISFDPRGIGRSTPPVSFFTTDAEHLSWDITEDSLDTSASPDSIARLIAKYQILGSLAKGRDNGILTHLTTDNVARDMKAMSESLGHDKLTYYGISYGTALGATYAALFPDKVERIVLDGVLDANVYYSGDWIPQIVDSDKVLQTFFNNCTSAGPQLCAFYESTPDAVSKRFTKLLDTVKTRPVAAYDPNDPKSQIYGIVDASVVRAAIFQALYFPYDLFASLAKALAALEQGDALPMYILGTGVSTANPDSGAQCDASNAVQYENTDQAAIAIQCADADPVSDDVEEMERYYEKSKGVAFTAPFFIGIRGRCAGWKVHPDHFTGPIAGNTSFPMLIIGNTKDPVTPLVRAKDTAARFPGSVVLTYDAAGHTSFTAVSPCVFSHVIQYFNNGTLPKEGTVCPLDPGVTFFPPAANSSTSAISKRADSVRSTKWLGRPFSL